MALLQTLQDHVRDHGKHFLLGAGGTLSLSDILHAPQLDLSPLKPGDVVAQVGGFDAFSVGTLLRLLDMGVIVVPLTETTQEQHPAMFAAACVNACIREGKLELFPRRPDPPSILRSLREKGDAGLVLFTSGTTGAPKAILHSAEQFLRRYQTPRKPMKAMAFLLFDHIGGINTLLHMLFNGGEVVVPRSMQLQDIVDDLVAHDVELLPATPTFLRLLLLHGLLDAVRLPALKIITYGTERMDQATLDALCATMPQVDLRQTYGMSELGILRIKSRARDSLWMQVGGEEVTWKIADDGTLHILAKHRMLGYLNAPQPFDDDGWYPTLDLVERDGEWLRITGRKNDQINVGGLKVMPEEVETAAMRFPGVAFARAYGKSNPITGMHVELECQFLHDSVTDMQALKRHLRQTLPPYAMPQRIFQKDTAISARYKRK